MPRLIITTVGTSGICGRRIIPDTNEAAICENLMKGEKTHGRERVAEALAARMAEEWLKEPSAIFRDRLSAELASLWMFDKYLKERSPDRQGIRRGDTIALFSSDTVAGEFCTKVNQTVLQKLVCDDVRPVTIEGLKVDTSEAETPIGTEQDKESFAQQFVTTGKDNLLKNVRVLAGEKDWGEEKYFNITGGFKGAIPFSTLIAFEHHMTLFYLYEESELILIEGPYPLIFKWDQVRVKTGRERAAL
jgi:CRISPR/Cas system-associated protein Csm6